MRTTGHWISMWPRNLACYEILFTWAVHSHVQHVFASVPITLKKCDTHLTYEWPWITFKVYVLICLIESLRSLTQMFCLMACEHIFWNCLTIKFHRYIKQPLVPEIKYSIHILDIIMFMYVFITKVIRKT